MNAFNAGIFKAYDIRGVYPAELDEEIVYKIGRAFVIFLKAKAVLVGRDARKSSDKLFASLAKGITDQGADVVDMGLCTTPMFYFANQKYPAGVMVTASHNPAKFNGLKLCREEAIPISGETGIEEIRSIVKGNRFEDVKKKGKIVKKDFLADYIKHVSKFIKNIKPLKAVVDAGNGMGGLTLPKIFAKTACNIIPLYFDIDCSFPNHEANPLKDEAVVDLQKSVIKEKADLGIAFDGDADRAAFFDEKGRRVPADLITALLAVHFLNQKKGQKIIYEVRSSWAVKEEIVKCGGIPLLERAGHAFIRKRMRDEDAVAGGEKSGHYFFRDNFYADSAIIAALLVLQILSESGKRMSELVKPLMRYFNSGELNFEVEDKDYALEKVEDAYSDGKISKVDGITIEFDDFWFNLRKSNTEPLIRLNLEAKSEKKMKDELKKIKTIILEVEK
jgi:phosphomannomutase